MAHMWPKFWSQMYQFFKKSNIFDPKWALVTSPMCPLPRCPVAHTPSKLAKILKNKWKSSIFDQWFSMTFNDVPWFSMTLNDFQHPWAHISRSFLMVVPRSDFNFWMGRRESEWTQQQYNIQAFHKDQVETVGIRGRVAQIKSRADREDSKRSNKKYRKKLCAATRDPWTQSKRELSNIHAYVKIYIYIYMAIIYICVCMYLHTYIRTRSDPKMSLRWWGVEPNIKPLRPYISIFGPYMATHGR